MKSLFSPKSKNNKNCKIISKPLGEINNYTKNSSNIITINSKSKLAIDKENQKIKIKLDKNPIHIPKLINEDIIINIPHASNNGILNSDKKNNRMIFQSKNHFHSTKNQANSNISYNNSIGNLVNSTSSKDFYLDNQSAKQNENNKNRRKNTTIRIKKISSFTQKKNEDDDDNNQKEQTYRDSYINNSCLNLRKNENIIFDKKDINSAKKSKRNINKNYEKYTNTKNMILQIIDTQKDKNKINNQNNENNYTNFSREISTNNSEHVSYQNQPLIKINQKKIEKIKIDKKFVEQAKNINPKKRIININAYENNLFSPKIKPEYEIKHINKNNNLNTALKNKLDKIHEKMNLIKTKNLNHKPKINKISKINENIIKKPKNVKPKVKQQPMKKQIDKKIVILKIKDKINNLISNRNKNNEINGEHVNKLNSDEIFEIISDAKVKSIYEYENDKLGNKYEYNGRNLEPIRYDDIKEECPIFTDKGRFSFRPLNDDKNDVSFSEKYNGNNIPDSENGINITKKPKIKILHKLKLKK